MDIKRSGNNYILKLNVGEEIISCLKEFMRRENLPSASFTSIGATEKAIIGYFDRTKKEYLNKTIDVVCEITSLIGNIGWTEENEPIIHAHITLGFPDYHVEGGHLVEAIIGVVGEIFVQSLDVKLTRKKDDTFGLMLLDLD